MPERLERFLAEVEPELGATRHVVPADQRRLQPASRRSPTSGPPTAATEKLVLRSDPRGDKGVFTSDRDREWPLLQAMWDIDTVEIPRPRWYDGTGELTGQQDHRHGPRRGDAAADRRSAQDADIVAARTVFLDVAAALLRTPLDRCRPTSSGPTTGTATSTARSTSTSGPSGRWSTAARSSATCRRGCGPTSPRPCRSASSTATSSPATSSSPTVAAVVIDWEFTRIGDPREDIGYYSGNPLPDSLYTADPEAFLAEYRELTGFTEEQVNPQVMEYFFILGMAELFVQMMQGADALSRGQAEGHHVAVPRSTACATSTRSTSTSARR